MIENRIGAAAGKVWEALKTNGPMTMRKLNIVSGLPADLANQGVGWLAREGKLTASSGARGDVLLTLRS